MFKSKKLAILAALLSLLMLVSVLAVPAFAEEAGTTAEAETTGVAEAETTAEPETEAGTGDGTEAGTSAGTGASTGEETTTAKKEETTTASKAELEAQKKQRTRGWINLGVGAVILIVLGILAFKFRAKIPGWWKGLKSECGKITWCPKDKLKKNTLVVVVIILVIAAAIGLLDFVFSKGIMYLGKLFH